MKVTAMRKDKMVKSEAYEYCCNEMQYALDANFLRKPNLTAQKPAIMVGTMPMSVCPFCGAKIEVVITEA